MRYRGHEISQTSRTTAGRQDLLGRALPSRPEKIVMAKTIAFFDNAAHLVTAAAACE
jgi:hypothetical protein